MAIDGFYEGGFLILDKSQHGAFEYVNGFKNFIWGKPYQIFSLNKIIKSAHIFDEHGIRINWPLNWAIPVVREATQEEMDQLIG